MTPLIDPKEELLQRLAESLIRDLFAAACLAGDLAQGYSKGDGTADSAFEQADSMLRRSYTPAIIQQMKDLKP